MAGGAARRWARSRQSRASSPPSSAAGGVGMRAAHPPPPPPPPPQPARAAPRPPPPPPAPINEKMADGGALARATRACPRGGHGRPHPLAEQEEERKRLGLTLLSAVCNLAFFLSSCLPEGNVKL
ncbi:PX domain-containing protein kinase-like protein isoform X2 [Anas acuta]|uniref:PX domain-containing protein kinase-like protein isoform X2 n=1 Tax=Anas acuta TaxID=28680 RepID=UPI0035C8EA61